MADYQRSDYEYAGYKDWKASDIQFSAREPPNTDEDGCVAEELLIGKQTLILEEETLIKEETTEVKQQKVKITDEGLIAEWKRFKKLSLETLVSVREKFWGY